LKTVLGNTCESIDPIHLVRRMQYINFRVIVKSQFFSDQDLRNLLDLTETEKQATELTDKNTIQN